MFICLNNIGFKTCFAYFESCSQGIKVVPNLIYNRWNSIEISAIQTMKNNTILLLRKNSKKCPK